MEQPHIWNLRTFRDNAEAAQANYGLQGYWPTRPIALLKPRWNRIRAAWLVFTGRADALEWHLGLNQ